MVVSKNNYPRAATRRKKSQNSKVIFFAPKGAYRSLTQPWHAKIAGPDLKRRLQWSMVSVLKTGFDNPVVWTGGPEEIKLHESGFNSIQQRQER
jgi:hypothetical protein